MSLNYKKGTPIALIRCKNNKKMDRLIIRVSTDKNDGVDEIILPKDCVLQVLPSVDASERYYISGPTGSGKSYFISKWLGMNRKIFKNKNKKLIYIFSRIKHDQQLDKFNPIRPELESLIDKPITMEDLNNAICIFDDIDSIKDKNVKNAVFDLRDDLLVCGRHGNVTVICTTHQLMNHNESKRCINESSSCVIYPQSGATYQINNFLKKYCGFSKDLIEYIKSINTRWICIRKLYPLIIIHEHGIIMATKQF